MSQRDRLNPSINAGSMADIAFLLLIFFLISTSIENPKGIQVLLPPYGITPPTEISEDRVITIRLNKDNQVLVEKELVDYEQLSATIKSNIQSIITRQEQPVVSFVTDTSALYNSYISVYDHIRSAYSELRNDMSLNKYAKPYDLLSKEKKLSVHRAIPMIISEADHF